MSNEERLVDAERKAFHEGFKEAVELLLRKERSMGQGEFIERALAELKLSPKFIDACRASVPESAASVSAYSDNDLCRGSTYYCPGYGCINTSSPCPPERKNRYESD